jgi:hypothetical protein
MFLLTNPDLHHGLLGVYLTLTGRGSPRNASNRFCGYWYNR